MKERTRVSQKQELFGHLDWCDQLAVIGEAALPKTLLDGGRPLRALRMVIARFRMSPRGGRGVDLPHPILSPRYDVLID